MNEDSFVRIIIHRPDPSDPMKMNLEVSAPEEWIGRIGRPVQTGNGIMIPIDVRDTLPTNKSQIIVPKIQIAPR